MNISYEKIFFFLCVIFLFIILKCITKKEQSKSTHSFQVNSSKTMDYQSSKIFGEKYKWYTPQGFALGKEYCYLSAYHLTGSCSGKWEKEHNETSKVFKIRLSDKTLVKVYNLVDQKNGSHVGGMSLIEETNQFFIASRKITNSSIGKNGICLYSMDEPDKDSKKEVDVTATSKYYYGTYCPNNCLGEYAPSFMFFDKRNSLLWYGQYNENENSTASICANHVKISGETAILEHNNSDYTFKLPTNNIQGMAIAQNTSVLVVYLSQSSGTNNSKILMWVPSSSGYLNTVAEGGPGLQNLDIDSNNKLWAVTEAGSKYYQSRDKSCGSDKGPWPSHLGSIYAEIQIPPLPEKETLDAVIYNSDSDMYYFFIGDSYYQKEYGSSKKIKGPFNIKNDWGNLPINDLDAAIYNSDSNIYYFFKGSIYYIKKYGQQYDVEGPFKLSNYNIPSDLDGALYNADTNKYYYFKDNKYYKKLDGSSEKAQGSWNIGDSGPSTGIPSKLNIESSIYNADSDMYYYFKDDKYYERDSGADTASSAKSITDWGGMII